MKGKIYITDEGYGPIVRQRAIIEEMKLLDNSIAFTVQTEKHIIDAQRIIPDVNFIKKHNNITWHKTSEGFPDVAAIKIAYANYNDLSEKYIQEELDAFNYDFILSDYVHEAFEIARIKKIPGFGIAHFTWDWFFSKLYPPPLSNQVLQRFFDYASKATVLYFPPYTPQEILQYYKNKIKSVPLIVRKQIQSKKLPASDKFRVLIMDSGSGVLKDVIQKGLNQIGEMDDIEFYISSTFNCDLKNVRLIDKNELFIDYIKEMDLVIGRAGFNTISECIALRTPMLLLSESMNPEMNENIINIKHEGLGSFISLKQFSNDLPAFLNKFIRSEYKTISENMKNHNIAIDGAKVVAEDILNRIK